jgi:molybdopterin-guanine dinucleotide biosynthesis protein A
VVIVGRGNSMARLHRAFPLAHVVRDQGHIQSPLVGLLAGAAALRSTYLAALPCDLPFLRPAILRHLFFAAKGHDAAIPRWPDGRIEPLVAVYKREPMSLAAQRALDAGERSNQSMIRRLADVRYVDVARLRSADPHLASFVNVNTPADLVRANELAMRLAPRPRTR